MINITQYKNYLQEIINLTASPSQQEAEQLCKHNPFKSMMDNAKKNKGISKVEMISSVIAVAAYNENRDMLKRLNLNEAYDEIIKQPFNYLVERFKYTEGDTFSGRPIYIIPRLANKSDEEKYLKVYCDMTGIKMPTDMSKLTPINYVQQLIRNSHTQTPFIFAYTYMNTKIKQKSYTQDSNYKIDKDLPISKHCMKIKQETPVSPSDFGRSFSLNTSVEYLVTEEEKKDNSKIILSDLQELIDRYS